VVLKLGVRPAALETFSPVGTVRPASFQESGSIFSQNNRNCMGIPFAFSSKSRFLSGAFGELSHCVPVRLPVWTDACKAMRSQPLSVAVGRF
jgi:hypothetical protein